MIKQAGNVWKRLRRFLTAGPGRFAGGSAVSDPLGLLAGERALLAARWLPQHDGSPRAAAMPDQSIQPGPSGDVTGPMERDRIRRNHRRPCVRPAMASALTTLAGHARGPAPAS
jgi:hypothetical protein